MATAKSIAKHYNHLTPRERMPLILAADARGDDIEVGRLIDSAPRVGYKFPHHLAFAMAFREVFDIHYMELLAIATQVWLSFAWLFRPEKRDDNGDSVVACSHQFRSQWEGWIAFCNDLAIDPFVFMKYMPGYELVKHTAHSTQQFIAAAERVDPAIRERLTTKELTASPAETVVAELHKALEARNRAWGG